MKSNLRRIFNQYDNSGAPGYSILREHLKKGVKIHYTGALASGLGEGEINHILASQSWIKVVGVAQDFFEEWHKLCLFEGDTYEITVEGRGSRKTRLQTYAFPVDSYDHPMFSGSVEIRMVDEGSLSKDLKKRFMGSMMKDQMESFCLRVLKKARTYLEDLSNYKLMGDILPSPEKHTGIIDTLNIRMSYWKIKKMNIEDKESLFSTDFGIKDLALFYAFMEAFETIGQGTDLERAQRKLQDQIQKQDHLIKLLNSKK